MFGKGASESIGSLKISKGKHGRSIRTALDRKIGRNMCVAGKTRFF